MRSSWPGILLLIVALGGCGAEAPTAGPPGVQADAASAPVISEINASCTAAASKDASGAPIDYAPAKMIDGVPDTAWRCDGDGIGQSIDITLDKPGTVTRLGLLPGYAKTDPVDNTDRYVQNRRISQVRYELDGGHSVQHALDDGAGGRQLQTIDVGSLTTQHVRIVILASSPGTAVSDKQAVDKVAISEVSVQHAGGAAVSAASQLVPGVDTSSTSGPQDSPAPKDHCVDNEANRAWWMDYGGRIGTDIGTYINVCGRCPDWYPARDECPNPVVGPPPVVPAEPVLGRSFGPYQEGYGTTRPSTISNGGDPTGIVQNVRWSAWGGQRAEADGVSVYVPEGAITADGFKQPARVVAFDLGSCGGQLAYRSVTWFFPSKGETFESSPKQNICSN